MAMSKTTTISDMVIVTTDSVRLLVQGKDDSLSIVDV